jgi:hypothetical protein
MVIAVSRASFFQLGIPALCEVSSLFRIEHGFNETLSRVEVWKKNKFGGRWGISPWRTKILREEARYVTESVLQGVYLANGISEVIG